MGGKLTCVERDQKDSMSDLAPVISKTPSFYLLRLPAEGLEMFCRGPLRQAGFAHCEPTFVVSVPGSSSLVLLGCRPQPGQDLSDYRCALFSFFGAEADWCQSLQHALNSYLASKYSEVIGAVHSGEALFLMLRQGQTYVEDFQVREIDKSWSALELEDYLNSHLKGHLRFRFGITAGKRSFLVLETLNFRQKDVYLVLEVRCEDMESFAKTLGERLEQTTKGRRLLLAGVVTELEFPGAYLVFTFIG